MIPQSEADISGVVAFLNNAISTSPVKILLTPNVEIFITLTGFILDSLRWIFYCIGASFYINQAVITLLAAK